MLNLSKTLRSRTSAVLAFAVLSIALAVGQSATPSTSLNLYKTLCARVNVPYVSSLYANYGGQKSALPLKWSIESGDVLPPGLSLWVNPQNSVDARITGTPTGGIGQTFEFSIIVTNAQGKSQTQEFYLYIGHDPAKTS